MFLKLFIFIGLAKSTRRTGFSPVASSSYSAPLMPAKLFTNVQILQLPKKRNLLPYTALLVKNNLAALYISV